MEESEVRWKRWNWRECNPKKKLIVAFRWKVEAFSWLLHLAPSIFKQWSIFVVYNFLKSSIFMNPHIIHHLSRLSTFPTHISSNAQFLGFHLFQLDQNFIHFLNFCWSTYHSLPNLYFSCFFSFHVRGMACPLDKFWVRKFKKVNMKRK